MSLEAFPAELFIYITSQLPYASHLALSLTCKSLYALTCPSPPLIFKIPTAAKPLNSKVYTLSDLLEIELWPCYDASAYIPLPKNPKWSSLEELSLHHSPNDDVAHPATSTSNKSFTDSSINSAHKDLRINLSAAELPADAAIQSFLLHPHPPRASRDFFVCSACMRIRSALHFLNDFMDGDCGKLKARFDKYHRLYGIHRRAYPRKRDERTAPPLNLVGSLGWAASGSREKRHCMECMVERGRLHRSGRMVRYGGVPEELSEEKGEETGYAIGCEKCMRFVRLEMAEMRRLRDLEKVEMAERERKRKMAKLVRRECRGCREEIEKERAKKEGKSGSEVARLEVKWP